MYVCVCNAVTEHDIRRAVANGARSFEDVQAVTRCSTTCGCCEAEARAQVQAALVAQRRAEALPVAA